MATKSLVRTNDVFPSVFSELLSPWEEFLDTKGFSRAMTIPAVNVSESNSKYMVSMAVPGMKKSDFHIDLDGNILSISAETSEEREIKDKDERYTRKEYNFSSFSRSFTLPEAVNRDKIVAKYEEGVLKLSIPKTEEAKKLNAKSINIQ